jgi:hypothetical protein
LSSVTSTFRSNASYRYRVAPIGAGGVTDVRLPAASYPKLVVLPSFAVAWSMIKPCSSGLDGEMQVGASVGEAV